ncbi:hypothetical protein CSAL01_11861 [Colletotrichum salicis]|uniref:Uncharacterized protein n=1 Tax=Colletotrichum salicis TaxID=1209931 RepID=A0A135UYT1_9PEZI|nr:hypothetical protein CSAL01_11861 [Colletotrichum salicis]
MYGLHLFLTVASVAAAAPSLLSRSHWPSNEFIRVNWHKDNARGISAISAWDSSGQVLHAAACGSEATLAAMKVRVEADDTGSGVVVLGTNMFQISSGLEVSGGATCSRMYNDADVTVECEVPLGSAVDLKPLSDPSDMIRGCSSSFEHANRMLRLSMFATSPVTTDDATGSHVERDSGVSGRQVDVCPPYTDRRKVGPDHKWHLAEQVTVSKEAVANSDIPYHTLIPLSPAPPNVFSVRALEVLRLSWLIQGRRIQSTARTWKNMAIRILCGEPRGVGLLDFRDNVNLYWKDK